MDQEALGRQADPQGHHGRRRRASWPPTRGADALIVSNHGGRQLDGAQSSIAALPAIVDAVGTQIEVHMDGGIRSGQDVLKAMALGAKGTLHRPRLPLRPGRDGRGRRHAGCLEIIHNELDLTMAFCGRTDIHDVDRSILLTPNAIHTKGDPACPTFPRSPASKTCASSPSDACRACSTTMPTPAPGPRAPTAPTRATSRRSSCASAWP